MGLMEMLKKMSDKDKGSLELLFSTPPMSRERYNSAVNRVKAEYPADNRPFYRERYMDNTAGLRLIKKAVEEMQEGDEQMMAREPAKAREHYSRALDVSAGDYAGNLKMAKCLLVMDRSREALQYASTAREVYPDEPQALHVMGMAHLGQKNYEQALSRFNAYQDVLPGNPNTIFFQGYSYEGMNQRDSAAGKYQAYLRQVTQGSYARHAYARLQEWGYI